MNDQKAWITEASFTLDSDVFTGIHDPLYPRIYPPQNMATISLTIRGDQEFLIQLWEALHNVMNSNGVAPVNQRGRLEDVR